MFFKFFSPQTPHRFVAGDDWPRLMALLLFLLLMVMVMAAVRACSLAAADERRHAAVAGGRGGGNSLITCAVEEKSTQMYSVTFPFVEELLSRRERVSLGNLIAGRMRTEGINYVIECSQ